MTLPVFFNVVGHTITNSCFSNSNSLSVQLGYCDELLLQNKRYIFAYFLSDIFASPSSTIMFFPPLPFSCLFVKWLFFCVRLCYCSMARTLFIVWNMIDYSLNSTLLNFASFLLHILLHIDHKNKRSNLYRKKERKHNRNKNWTFS